MRTCIFKDVEGGKEDLRKIILADIYFITVPHGQYEYEMNNKYRRPILHISLYTHLLRKKSQV
jgi:hypothetical protein